MLNVKKAILFSMILLIGLVVFSCANVVTTETLPEISQAVELKNADAHRKNSAYIMDKKLYIRGENRVGQLGNGTFIESDDYMDITSHFNLNSNDEIISVQLGEYHGMALSKKGKVFIWGHNAFGLLTLESSGNQNLPLEISSKFDLSTDEFIVYIEAGRESNAVISNLGRVFTWGANAYGQLGIGEKTLPWEGITNIPQDITESFDLEDDFIKKIEIGNNHSMALSYRGRLFVWGSNERGQLGIESIEYALSPRDITHKFTIDDDLIKDADIGYNHTGVLTESGRVFVFGDNTLGQLAEGGKVEYSSIPLEIKTLPESDKALSLNFSHESSSIVTDKAIYVFGYNINYQLGLIVNSSINMPTLLENTRFEAKEIDEIIIAKEVFIILYQDGSLKTYDQFNIYN